MLNYHYRNVQQLISKEDFLSDYRELMDVIWGWKGTNVMLKVGSSCTKIIAADEDTIKRIADVSGDTNPIHIDKEYAERSIFGRRIAHGLFA